MVKFISVLILLVIIGTSLADTKPGIIAVAKETVVDKLIQIYFEKAFNMFKSFELPEEIREKNIKIKNIRGEILKLDKNNIEVNFNPAINGFSVTVKKVKVEVHSRVEVKKVVKIKGNVKATGTVDHIKMDISLASLPKDGLMIPQVFIKNMDLSMNHKNFKYVFECRKCLRPVKDLVLKIFRKKITKKVKSSMNNLAAPMGTKMVNEILDHQYPTTINLIQNLGFASGLSGQIRVKSDHIEIPIDGTFFAFNSGYSRVSSLTPMPSYNEENPGDVMAFVNQYVVDSLTHTLNLEEYSFALKLFFMRFNLLSGPEHGSTAVSLTDGSLEISSSVKIETNLGVTLKVRIGGSLDFDLKKGRGANIASVVTDLKSINFQNLEINLFGYDMNFTILNPLMNLVVKVIMNFVSVPKVNIPQHELLPLKVKEGRLEFNQGYVETGVSFSGI